MTRSVWLSFASFSFAALLGSVLAVGVLLVALVPQGWIAVELAGASNDPQLQTAYAWGLTELVDSPWLKALAVLIGGNLVALAVRMGGAQRAPLQDTEVASLEVELDAPRPEKAVEWTREGLTRLFGRPTSEAVDGAKVVLTYLTAPRARWTPFLSHLGLVLLLFGGVLAGRPASRAGSVVRTELVVRDAESASIGSFDLAQDETINFFQNPLGYTVRRYVPNQGGLGPAVQVEVSDQGRPFDAFWVFQDAPPGFDAKHRRGEVAITALSMGYAPRPGEGLPSRPEAVLILLGFGLLAASLLELGRPEGAISVEAHGRNVVMRGWPRSAKDPRFARMFEESQKWVRWYLERAG